MGVESGKTAAAKFAAKQENCKKKFSAKYDRLVQELWALESDCWVS